MARSRHLAFATVAVALVAAPAYGLSIIPNPVSLNNAGIVGSIELVDVVTGLPAGGVVGDGTVGASDTTLVFEADVVAAAPFDSWGVIVVGLRPVGGGMAFIAPTATGGIPPDVNLDEGVIVGNTAHFQGLVDEGSSSDLFFVSYASPIATDGSLELFFRAGSGVNLADGLALIVPEPGMAGLLALGAALVGVQLGRGRRARSTTPDRLERGGR